MDWNADPEMKQLRQEFMGSFAERRALLVPILKSLHAVEAAPSVLKDLQFLAHKLAGVAGSYGFPSLSRVAGCLDDVLESWNTKNSALNFPVQLPELVKLAETLDQMLEQASREEKDPASLISGVAALLSAASS